MPDPCDYCHTPDTDAGPHDERCINSDRPTNRIFALARAEAANLAAQLEPLPDGTNWLGDDGCDYLDATMTVLDLTSRALRSDYRDEACSLLIDALTHDAPAMLTSMPNDFDDLGLDSFHDLASGLTDLFYAMIPDDPNDD